MGLLGAVEGRMRNGTLQPGIVMVDWGIPAVVPVSCLLIMLHLSLVVSGCRCENAPAGVLFYWESPRKNDGRKFSSLIFRAISRGKENNILFPVLLIGEVVVITEL